MTDVQYLDSADVDPDSLVWAYKIRTRDHRGLSYTHMIRVSYLMDKGTIAVMSPPRNRLIAWAVADHRRILGDNEASVFVTHITPINDISVDSKWRDDNDWVDFDDEDYYGWFSSDKKNNDCTVIACSPGVQCLMGYDSPDLECSSYKGPKVHDG